MKPDEYGASYQEHLLEQYKLYVEMADRVSQRRDQSNRFYVTIVSALVALLIVMARIGVSDAVWIAALLIAGIFGAALSGVWALNIRSYRELNTAKFTIINDIERQLPYAGYTDEWELLRPQGARPKYLQLTRVEQLVPYLVLLIFAGIAAYGAFLFFAGKLGG